MSLSEDIVERRVPDYDAHLKEGRTFDDIDEYGFTPLIEAAIVDNIRITQLLLANGANPNQQDVTGGTAIQWAVENNNLALAKLLLDHRADPNAYNL